MPIPAVIGVVSFSLAILPNYYCQTPMVIIGKIYANSMLVLINSRMLLVSEEAPLTTISAIGFDAAPATSTIVHTWRRSRRPGRTFGKFRAEAV